MVDTIWVQRLRFEWSAMQMRVQVRMRIQMLLNVKLVKATYASKSNKNLKKKKIKTTPMLTMSDGWFRAWPVRFINSKKKTKTGKRIIKIIMERI